MDIQFCGPIAFEFIGLPMRGYKMAAEHVWVVEPSGTRWIVKNKATGETTRTYASKGAAQLICDRKNAAEKRG